MGFVATINTPGYLPQDDDPPVFDTAQEAWAWLAGELAREEEDEFPPDGLSGSSYYCNNQGHFTVYRCGCCHGDTVAELRNRALPPVSVGTVYGPTPGYEGEHDLGRAYCVTEVRP